ncbi:hypothetical protein [Streptomyces lateritius]|uniref:hypothetical protein n=1 Tax=Streptomyces lateritius TaxID=67313 RepID=UPI0016768BD4|nr:hypothetical protein [Streptomyces lateritius]GGT63771.1 hypothetical protein GCM10010272_02360 [Streptomyces lateritius]
MVAFHSSVLDGAAADPALRTPLLLRLIAFEGRGDGPPFQALRRELAENPSLPADLVARLLEDLAVPGPVSSAGAGADPAVPPGGMTVAMDEAGVPA